ncbi:MAG: GatB/YqeY domain-containing protein [Chloroflexi bacterium]|nr:GatB/YqeY domain-containing protein [Chloroflexota bacterium]MDA1240168.1 GatB/YqeY domain-containing protein [Chloroflexota bacterium]
MSAIQDTIRTEMTTAWKAGDNTRRDALRLLMAALEYARIDLGRPLEDADTIRVLQKEAKQRRDSITEYEKAKRSDLVDKEQAELNVIVTFLPQQLEDDEIRELARAVIAETGASGAGDVGKIMRPLIARVAGRADGSRINQIAREVLGT